MENEHHFNNKHQKKSLRTGKTNKCGKYTNKRKHHFNYLDAFFSLAFRHLAKYDDEISFKYFYLTGKSHFFSHFNMISDVMPEGI